MTLDYLQTEMQNSLRNGDKLRRAVLADIIAQIQRNSTSGSKRVDITESYVNEQLIKYEKTVKEMVDTCPSTRSELLEEYNAKLNIVREYAPRLLTNREEILSEVNRIISENNIEKKDYSKVLMRTVAKELKGKADMAVVREVVSNMQ